jgi:hypothetical protein
MTEEKPETPPQAATPAEPKTEVQPQAAPQQAQPGAPGDYQEVDMMAQANAFLQKPMVKKYVGGMGKMMIFFAIMGCLVMVGAIFAITSLFNMIIPK